jgi:hypothetical protein
LALKPYLNKDNTEVGLDEAGRGCLAGPVVAAAVVLPKKFNHPFLNDSKKLSEKINQSNSRKMRGGASHKGMKNFPVFIYSDDGREHIIRNPTLGSGVLIVDKAAAPFIVWGTPSR